MLRKLNGLSVVVPRAAVHDINVRNGQKSCPDGPFGACPVYLPIATKQRTSRKVRFVPFKVFRYPDWHYGRRTEYQH